MTILEALIKLRDDIKLWVTNNLNQKANIDYVDEKIAEIPEFDPTDLQAAIAENTTGIQSNGEAIQEIKDDVATHNSEFATLAGNVDNIDAHLGMVDDDLDHYKTEVSEQFTTFETTINTHTANTENPHGVTKEQVGLANVDNTSDIEKPISNATQEALNEKANSEHVHNASHITDGILEVAYGGTGYDSIVDTEYTTPRYRASALVAAETIPSENGIINWMYE